MSPPVSVVCRTAEFDKSGTYRYSLGRGLSSGEGRVVFVMLNPSIADGNQDDATIRRCLGFAETWGFRELVAVNLFGFRATNPDVLNHAEDPIGPRNDEILVTAVRQASQVVVGWGDRGRMMNRDIAVLRMLEDLVIVPYALGLTASGAPRHPLYARKDSPRCIVAIP